MDDRSQLVDRMRRQQLCAAGNHEWIERDQLWKCLHCPKQQTTAPLPRKTRAPRRALFMG